MFHVYFVTAATSQSPEAVISTVEICLKKSVVQRIYVRWFWKGCKLGMSAILLFGTLWEFLIKRTLEAMEIPVQSHHAYGKCLICLHCIWPGTQ